MTNHLILYQTEENKSGAMVVGAENESQLAGILDTELSALLGNQVKYWYTSVDLSKTKAHIYDLRPPTNSLERRTEATDADRA